MSLSLKGIRKVFILGTEILERLAIVNGVCDVDFGERSAEKLITFDVLDRVP
jgi:hypothetical protein